MDFTREVEAAAHVAGLTNRSLSSIQDDTQNFLLRIITENPGIWYREILRLTGLPNGTLSYHLRELEEAARIKVRRIDHLGKTRYYSASVPDSETNIIACVKIATARQIILVLIDREFCTFSELVSSVDKSPSTISWHLKRLISSGIVGVRHGELSLYSLAERDAVIEVLSKYRESILDTVVNNYTDLIDEL